ncbi:MAG: aminoglycoside phosphotransferase family protein [Pseudomonadaceae bacterium]|nr:aminoglycoside phosphotransferase family protein [Pseudomonadaceae bacterium]
MNPVLHDNEFPIDDSLVYKLVSTQFPDYADLPRSRLNASGSSNVLYRLGDELLVRLPRQPGSGAAIEKEKHWLPVLSRHLPVAVPEIKAWGKPAFGFTEPWSIVQWIDGELPPASGTSKASTSSCLVLAADLADVIIALRNIKVPEEASSDSRLRGYRGRSLADYDKYFRRTIEDCRRIEELDLNLDKALGFWQQALTLPGADQVAPDCWYHSDLVAENLLLTNDRLCAVLDFGGLAVGDPTIDLHGAWELFDPHSREVFRTRLGVDNAQWLRGRAWALAIALGTFSYYWTKMPQRMRHRLVMAQAVLAEFEDGGG